MLENEVKMPKIRSMKSVIKDGALLLRNCGDGMFQLELVDTETTYTQEQQDEDIDIEYGFTNTGNPVRAVLCLEDYDIASALIQRLDITKPRVGSTVELGI